RWQDWLADIEGGLAVLNDCCERVFVIGLSMGGLLALTAAARYPMAGVISMSAPYQAIFSPAKRRWLAATLWLRPLQHKPQEQKHPTLPERREKNYPAYPAYPPRILLELDALIRAMQAGLPQVQAPALLIHSYQDAAIPVASLEQIYARLGSPHKKKLLLEGFNHALVQDPKRQVVFDAIAAFIARTSQE
ncbi:MAG: alpha/beta fold hydrolase, partial [Anaerolineales bacterium]|nr:alpha/beta fold hydrolase [Anaerolineales bacterium]